MPGPRAETISLPEMIQVFSMSAVPRLIRITDRDGRLGWIELKGGEVTHASTHGGVEGFEAVTEMMTWPEVNAFVASRESDNALSRNINRSISSLLLDAFDASEDRAPSEEPPEEDDYEIEEVSDGLSEKTQNFEHDISFLLSLTSKFKNLTGFKVAHIIDMDSSRAVDSFGDMSILVPEWAHDTLIRLRGEKNVDFTVVCSGPHVDFLIALAGDEPSMFCRLERTKTNLGLAFHVTNEALQNRRSS